MLRILLLGRTGNHLFQYALGRMLAEKHGVPLVLDASWFNRDGWAEVSHFLKLPIQAQVIRPCPIASRALRKITGKHYWEYRGVPILREPSNDQSFDIRFLNAPADCMLFGYFQTPLYFNTIANPLRCELNKMFAAAIQLPDDLTTKLTHPNSVAIHVRRKDYLQQPIFNVCDSAYYHGAIRTIRASLSGARFFVFSDDPNWCRGEFRDEDTAIIDSKEAGKNPLHDLHLMSLASHHIIANSTYSWWAAWLGDKPDQQIIMPNQWYAHGIKAPMAEKTWKS